MGVRDFIVFTTAGMYPYPAAAFATIASVISDRTLHAWIAHNLPANGEL